MMHRALRVVSLGLLGLTALVLWRGMLQPIFPMRVHLLLHVLGAMVFLGNVVAGAVWLTVADVGQDAAAMRFATRAINICDLALTAPAGTLTLLNGAVLATAYGGTWGMAWLRTSSLLFVGTVLLWSVVLVPLQIHIEKRAVLHPVSTFRKTLVAYYVLGGFAGLLIILTLVQMVLR